LRRRLFIGEINNRRDSYVEESPRVASVESISKPEPARHNFAHCKLRILIGPDHRVDFLAMIRVILECGVEIRRREVGVMPEDFAIAQSEPSLLDQARPAMARIPHARLAAAHAGCFLNPTGGLGR
jgi:hypothetical protein